jgi:hypothetical protein
MDRAKNAGYLVLRLEEFFETREVDMRPREARFETREISRSREIVRETRSFEKCLSPYGKGPMVVLGGGFLMSEVPLYGTDPSEIHSLSLHGYLSSKNPPPLGPP